MEHEQLMDANETCKLLNMKRRTLYKLVREQRIPVIIIGKMRRFSKPDVLLWLSEKKVGSKL